MPFYGSSASETALQMFFFIWFLLCFLPQLKIQDSMYAVLLEDWLRVIPRDRFLFLRSEDYKRDTKGTLENIFNFLELSQYHFFSLPRLLHFPKSALFRNVPDLFTRGGIAMERCYCFCVPVTHYSIKTCKSQQTYTHK